MNGKRFLLCFIGIGLLFALGCGVKSVRSFGSDPAGEFANSISQTLVTNGFYKVIERENLQTVISEHQLTISGLTQQDASQQIGQLLGADAIITGDISDYSFKGHGEWVKVKRYNSKEKKNYFEKQFKAFRKARIEVTIKIINVKTGQIAVSRTYSKESQKNVRKKTRTGAINALPSGKKMLSDLRNIIVRVFVNEIAPHTVYKQERLLTGKDPRMKDALKFALGGLWENAIPIWKEIGQTGVFKDKKACFYNLSVAYQALSDYNQALQFIEEALRYGSDSLLIKKKSELRILKEKREKVIEQIYNR
jgi:curli biogenesis system outer membrane secretion channel CsgG